VSAVEPYKIDGYIYVEGIPTFTSVARVDSIDIIDRYMYVERNNLTYFTR